MHYTGGKLCEDCGFVLGSGEISMRVVNVIVVVVYGTNINLSEYYTVPFRAHSLFAISDFTH